MAAATAAGRLIIGRFPSAGAYLHEQTLTGEKRARRAFAAARTKFLSTIVEIVVNPRTIPRKSSVSTRSTQTPSF